MMNSKGQSLYGIILTAIIALIVGMLFLNFIKPEVDNSMNAMNCGTDKNPNMSLTDGQKSMCLVGESISPYYILAILGVIGGLIAERVIVGGSIITKGGQ
jgi:L-lactate permease